MAGVVTSVVILMAVILMAKGLRVDHRDGEDIDFKAIIDGQ